MEKKASRMISEKGDLILILSSNERGRFFNYLFGYNQVKLEFKR